MGQVGGMTVTSTLVRNCPGAEGSPPKKPCHNHEETSADQHLSLFSYFKLSWLSLEDEEFWVVS